MRLPILLACCAFLSPLAARADAPDQATQQALSADYQLACAAALNPTDDALQAMFGVLSPAFTSTDVTGGQVSRAQIVDTFGSQLKMFHTTTCDTKITAIQTNPDGTIATTDVMHLSGSAPLQGSNHTFGLALTSQDTWSNASGKWLIAHRKDLHTHLEMDGSVVMDQGS
ncbi:MAG TPA: hypothetical protein VGF18_06150 [Candidatus Tumulicola sp.]|jgi:hypothetical protein